MPLPRAPRLRIGLQRLSLFLYAWLWFAHVPLAVLQVLGGELAARLMCGEEVTLNLVMQQVFQNPKPPQ